ncbi:hypothetical protein BDN72DRAFT_839506 [Pluteus cervinus]|uniref:Uncharacterized protein n=1 Tax=Pluteus cervinus TaxID=181527 RepID=A0ACD3AWG4_9AGAR|nr:hypothetical protein BDN72DRAFT_839506 [Pluteus cervinus]
MPPRRSSRSARPSVEPQPAEALPAKRKRGSTAEPEVEKPKARRASSARASVPPAAKGRASTRSKASLGHVEEEDDKEEEEEEEQESAPPAKKPRPSADGLDEEEDEEEEEEEDPKPKRRSSTTAARRNSKPPSKAEASGSRASSRRLSAAPPSTSRPSRPNGRAVKKEEPLVEEDEEEDEEEEPRPKSRSNGRSAANGRTTSRKKVELKSDVEMEVPDEDDDDDSDPPAPVKGRRTQKGRAPAAAKGKKKAPLYADDDDVSENEKPLKGKGKQNGKPVQAKPPPRTPSPELPPEEEKSLFDPPPAPTPAAPVALIPEEPKGPVARLMIYKLVLINFKSYAGRQEIGPFHKSFSSIVGPNGSGKSNTIDALLFVFGYRASKMRQGKLSELIHNSAEHPDLDECSVEVHFQEIMDLPGPNEFEIVSGSHLSVTRHAYKNNSSKYTINGRGSNYKDVQALLKGKGIDLDHNRFLILQGEVESIALMKPKATNEHEDGLLEYLEDIIGTSQYKEPIEEALVDVERLQEERAEKMNRLRLVERDKAALEAKKKEAEDYLRLKNEHVRALSRYYQWYLWRCLMLEKDLDDKVEKYATELSEETERNKDDITHLEMLRTHYKSREEAYEEVQAAAAAAMKELAELEKQAVSVEERAKHANGKIKKLSKSLKEDKEAKQKAVHAISDNSEKLIKQKEQVEEHEEKLDLEERALEAIRDSLKDKTQVFHEQIETKQKELQPWTTKINKKQADVDVATSERDALAKRAEQLKTASQEAQDTFQQLQSDQQVKIQEQDKLKRHKAGLQAQIQVAEKKLQDAQAQAQQWRGKATASRQRVDEAKSSQAANRSQGKVLDTLNRLKDSGRIQGFHGRLGNLGTIPDKYDVGISTACSALSNLVVDKVDQGQECIEYLRRQNVGRASFMVLEKLPRTSGMNKISTPENVPRLYDLIKPKDDRFAPAFYKAVRDTLVADDLEQANRIAFGAKRWRVVTLSGQLIDTSGTMSGGGSQPSRGGMSSKFAADTVSPDVLKTYEQESDQASKKFEEASEHARTAESELDRLKQSGPQSELAYEKLVMDIETGRRRIAEAEKRVRDLMSQNKPNAGDLARISKLEGDIDAATAELEELQGKSEKITKAIQDLEKKIMDIGGSRLMAQKSKVDGLRLLIQIANDELTKAEVGKAKAEKDSVKYDSTIEANEAALEELKQGQQEYEKQLAELQENVAALQENVEEAQGLVESRKEDCDKLKKELDKKEEQIQAFRKKEMELTQALNDAQKEQKLNNEAIEQVRAEHDSLTLEEIDDDDEDEDAEEDGEIQAGGSGERMEATAPDGDGEPQVKAEPGQRPKVKRERTPSHELHIYSEQELSKFRKRELLADKELLDEKVKNAKPDLSVLQEYRKREEEFLNRAKDLDKITEMRDNQKQKYEGLRKQRLDEFMAGFNLISLKLKEMYQMITLGGNAELELVDSMDPFSEGIIFSVMPPKKSWKNISNLSGGEKTLSSLALVFALHVFKPTPLYFMDEIDAALDFRNVSIVANYIKDRTKNAQFIIISLRNDMFELSHRLIGIYKTSNQTRSISIDNHALTSIPTASNDASHEALAN